MFSKAAKGDMSFESPSSAPRGPTPASLVGEGVRMKGDIVTEGDLHLDGAIEGDVKVGRLTVGGTGSVTGTIQADSIEVHGRVAGTINARQVKLWSTAKVDGDIAHGELAIEAGAHFVGRSAALIPDRGDALSVIAGGVTTPPESPRPAAPARRP
jgi:cytoskeletal protein CcmA (bactofilin family)